MSDKIERTLDIDAPIQRVWECITEAGHLGRWFGDAGATIDLRPGGELSLSWKEHGTCLGVVDVVEEPKLFVFRWARGMGVKPEPGKETVVAFSLTEHCDGTTLHLVESGFEALPDAQEAHDGNSQGWTAELGELVTYLGTF